MACQHRDAHLMLDAREDQLVCTMCGLVLRDRPSLCTDPPPPPGVGRIPDKTRALLLQMAKRLRVPETHLMRAAALAVRSGATCRHPASVAACFVVTGGTGSLKDAERALGIPHRNMSRAVSRLRRAKLKS